MPWADRRGGRSQPFAREDSIEPPWQLDSATGGELLRLVAMSTNDGIWDWDLKASRVFYSMRWLELVGLPADSAADGIEVFLDRVHPEDVDKVRSTIERHLNTDSEEYKVVFRLGHSDGSWRWISSRGIALRDAVGRAYRMAGTHTDITENVLASERLEQLVVERTADLRASRDRAELAASAVAKFLAATSHDVRQPLQAMALLLGSLERETLSESGKSTLLAVRRSLLASMELLDHLLEYSRIGAGALRSSVGLVDLGELVESVASSFTAEAEARGIDLRIAGCSYIVRSDPQMLRRILRNLVCNAFKYTEHGRVIVGCRLQRGSVRLEVWDTGCGIAAEKQRQIFWEFVQLNGATHGNTGLGLGLTIVERLAALLGHELTVRSEVGRGSMFGVTMPRENRANWKPSAATAEIFPPPSGQPLRVALVEDSPEIVAAFRDLFAKWNWVLAVAQDLDTMLEYLGGRPPDLLIVDWHIRGQPDGFAIYDALERTFDRHLPGVVLTGDYDFEELKLANASRRKVVHKPILPDVLAMVLRAELHSGSGGIELPRR